MPFVQTLHNTYHWFYPDEIEAWRRNDNATTAYVHVSADPARRQFGNLVLSRYPVVFSRNHLLPKLGSIDALSVQRSSLETTLDVNGTLLRAALKHFPEVNTRVVAELKAAGLGPGLSSDHILERAASW